MFSFQGDRAFDFYFKEMKFMFIQFSAGIIWNEHILRLKTFIQGMFSQFFATHFEMTF